MLGLQDFISSFRDQFVLLEADEKIEEHTEFKKISGYDSLTALLIISMIDEKYNVSIGGDVMRKCKTIGELYDSVNSKLKNFK